MKLRLVSFSSVLPLVIAAAGCSSSTPTRPSAAPPAVSTVQIVINAPTPVTPLNGAVSSQWPTLTVADAAHSGPAAALVYRFEIATDEGFTATIISGTVPETPGQTSFTPSNTTAPSVESLFWRATVLDQINGVSSPATAAQHFTYAIPSGVAATVAAQEGVALWSGIQPPGTTGHATLGQNWQVQTLHHLPTNTFFQSPTVEMLRFFDLSDRGFDPQSAINWLNGNGYPTAAQWYPPPEKAVLGFQFVYLAARGKVLVNTTWDLVLKLE